MKKILLVIVFIVIILGLFWVIHIDKVVSDEEIGGKPLVKIGVSLPMSGEASYIGEPSKFAANMALEKWKKKDTKYEYELVFEDDQFSTRVSGLVANKMLDVDKVRALITIWDVASPVDMEIAKRRNIIHIGCTWGNDMSDGVNNFNNVSSHKEHAEKMIKLLKSQNVSKVGYIAQVFRGDLDLKKTLIKELEKNDIEVVFEEEFHGGNKDFRMFLAKIKDKQADMIIVTMLPDDFYSFVKQKREVGLNIPVTTIDYFESIEDKSMAEGAYYVISAPGNKEFIEELSKNTNVIGQCIANVHDDIDLLIYAFERAKAEEGQIPTTEEVVKTLHSMKKYKGVLGDITIEPTGHIDSPALIRKIENGQSVDADI